MGLEIEDDKPKPPEPVAEFGSVTTPSDPKKIPLTLVVSLGTYYRLTAAAQMALANMPPDAPVTEDPLTRAAEEALRLGLAIRATYGGVIDLVTACTWSVPFTGTIAPPAPPSAPAQTGRDREPSPGHEPRRARKTAASPKAST